MSSAEELSAMSPEQIKETVLKIAALRKLEKDSRDERYRLETLLDI
jgi:hypothetical protein